MITLSPAAPNDVRGMVEVFYKTWLATYPNAALGITTEDIEEQFKNAFTEVDLEKRRQHIEATKDTTCRIIAKDQGTVVGIATLAQRDTYNELQSLYVLPEYQHQGIGTQLWEEVKKFAAPEKETVVFVATYNQSALHFYEKLGFVDTGIRDTDERHRMPISGVLMPVMKMRLKEAV